MGRSRHWEANTVSFGYLERGFHDWHHKEAERLALVGPILPVPIFLQFFLLVFSV
jgi:hypothetical protein